MDSPFFGQATAILTGEKNKQHTQNNKTRWYFNVVWNIYTNIWQSISFSLSLSFSLYFSCFFCSIWSRFLPIDSCIHFCSHLPIFSQITGWYILKMNVIRERNRVENWTAAQHKYRIVDRFVFYLLPIVLLSLLFLLLCLIVERCFTNKSKRNELTNEKKKKEKEKKANGWRRHNNVPKCMARMNVQSCKWYVPNEPNNQTNKK